MLDTGCPIVRTILPLLRNNDFDTFGLAVSDFADWESIEEDAKQPIHEDTARLRGFYVLEFLYGELLNRMIINLPTTSANVPFLPDGPYPREASALVQLLEDLSKLQLWLQAHATILKIKGNRKNASLQISAIANNVAALLTLIEEAVDILLGCLRRSDTQRLGGLGRILYNAMKTSNCTISTMEIELRTILSIHKENAITPWQRKKKNSQV